MKKLSLFSLFLSLLMGFSGCGVEEKKVMASYILEERVALRSGFGVEAKSIPREVKDVAVRPIVYLTDYPGQLTDRVPTENKVLESPKFRSDVIFINNDQGEDESFDNWHDGDLYGADYGYQSVDSSKFKQQLYRSGGDYVAFLGPDRGYLQVFGSDFRREGYLETVSNGESANVGYLESFGEHAPTVGYLENFGSGGSRAEGYLATNYVSSGPVVGYLEAFGDNASEVGYLENFGDNAANVGYLENFGSNVPNVGYLENFGNGGGRDDGYLATNYSGQFLDGYLGAFGNNAARVGYLENYGYFSPADGYLETFGAIPREVGYLENATDEVVVGVGYLENYYWMENRNADAAYSSAYKPLRVEGYVETVGSASPSVVASVNEIGF